MAQLVNGHHPTEILSGGGLGYWVTRTMKPNLLLVEDTEDDAFIFKRTLRKSGLTCAVDHVTDGAKAITFLQKAQESGEFPSAIFLDLKMPVLNGFEVLEWMQKQTFPPQMRVIVLSGSEHRNDKERAQQLGASDYLVKPIRIDDFNRYLQDLCPATPAMGAPV